MLAECHRLTCVVIQVKRFVQETKEAARVGGFVSTLGGRRRPIRALPGRGLTSQQAGAEADRKAVNSTIQGSAADLIKGAMCAWAHWHHTHMPPGNHMQAVVVVVVCCGYRGGCYCCCGCNSELASSHASMVFTSAPLQWWLLVVVVVVVAVVDFVLVVFCDCGHCFCGGCSLLLWWLFAVVVVVVVVVVCCRC